LFKLFIISIIMLLLAVIMTMAGRGGGNFYVLILVFSGVPMHQAATTGQFILFLSAISALLVFQKNRVVIWPLAVFIGSLSGLAALAGGYCSHWFSGFSLKVVFSCLLANAGMIMLVSISEPESSNIKSRSGYWILHSGDNLYTINVWFAATVTLLAGFSSGMVGVSGGSFLVPLMVLACGVPMRIAVGTASTLIAVTAFMGFVGHALHGDFNPAWAMPLAIATVIGGFIGGKSAMKTKPTYLKHLFAWTTLFASIIMAINAFYSK